MDCMTRENNSLLLCSREYLVQAAPAMRADNPQLLVEELKKSGSHPKIIAFYSKSEALVRHTKALLFHVQEMVDQSPLT